MFDAEAQNILAQIFTVYPSFADYCNNREDGDEIFDAWARKLKPFDLRDAEAYVERIESGEEELRCFPGDVIDTIRDGLRQLQSRREMSERLQQLPIGSAEQQDRFFCRRCNDRGHIEVFHPELMTIIRKNGLPDVATISMQGDKTQGELLPVLKTCVVACDDEDCRTRKSYVDPGDPVRWSALRQYDENVMCRYQPFGDRRAELQVLADWYDAGYPMFEKSQAEMF